MRLILAGTLALSAAIVAAAGAEYRAVPGASLRTIFPPDAKTAPATVASFAMRTTPVSANEFQRFLQSNPRWQRDRVATILADSHYLASWPSAAAVDRERGSEPVTQVSWFAAQAYCESEGARLPTWHEWELAAAADEKRIDARDDPAWRTRILSWYSQTGGGPLPKVGSTAPNVYGIRDLHGVVWEWVHDFGSLMVSADSREQSDPDTMKFCGAGALSANDRDNYAVLMRVALLSSLDARGTTRNLGFRCVRPIAAKTKTTQPRSRP